MKSEALIPTQQEVDALASFIEAAEELRIEPFFSPDDKKSLRMEGDKITYVFGDRCHFRSALISFRRIWLKGEDSHFEDIILLLEKYENSGFWIRQFGSDYASTKERIVCKKINLTGEALVDLWLNAVFAHHNLKKKRQNPKRYKWDRIDFDRLDREIGHAAFEFQFRQIVHHLGLCSLNILNVARHALSRWEKEYGLRPSFSIGTPFGRGYEEKEKDGTIVIRRPSSEYFSNETLEQKLKRFLARHEFSILDSIMKTLELPETRLVTETLRSISYEDFVANAGYQIERATNIDLDKLYAAVGNDEDLIAVLPESEMYTGEIFITAVYKSKKILTHESALRFLDKKFQRLKKLL